ncbi:MAG: hypothetical protein OSB41_15190, partial [Kiritimatiellae bacterium]|nr:hypothetical protein [Kiritimatiellia bacterium]
MTSILKACDPEEACSVVRLERVSSDSTVINGVALEILTRCLMRRIVLAQNCLCSSEKENHSIHAACR